MTRFGHKLNYVINTFVKHTPGLFKQVVPPSLLNGIAGFGCKLTLIVI